MTKKIMKNSIEILKNEPLAPHTFYGVGGPANEFWRIGTLAGLGEIWAETMAQGIPFFVLGKGSNLLFSDKGFRGRVFLLEFNQVTWDKPSPFSSPLQGEMSATADREVLWGGKKEGFLVTVESGKSWQDFVEETNKKGFGDLCNLSGIPGNVGGFVRGNAGAFGVETGDFIEFVEFLDETGTTQKFSKKKCEFKYRESVFKHHPAWCIMSATFKLAVAETAPYQLLERTKALLADRWKKYPPGRSGGSFFKNPEPGKIFAGELLEKAGAKGDQIGYAQISDRHANFIVNLQGRATQEDILKLARKWKQIVFKKFSVTLEPEVMIVDEKGKKIEI